MIKLERVGFIGQGKLARGLSGLIHQAYPSAEILISARSEIAAPLEFWSISTIPDLTNIDLLVLAVTDAEISSVAQQLAKLAINPRLVIHCSGSLGVEALSPLIGQSSMLAAVHPAYSFTGAFVGLDTFHGTTLAIESSAVNQLSLEQLFSPLSENLIFSEDISRAHYHAASVMASNLLVGLSYAAQTVAEQSGIPAEQAASLVNSLMRNTLENLQQNSPSDALTGPVKRGDIATVEKHLSALSQHPELRDAYASLSTIITELAHGNQAAGEQLREALKK
ncbi:MAG: Rossmann-like and DUF2520 domain-containing protein [Pseudomonadales bacterium]